MVESSSGQSVMIVTTVYRLTLSVVMLSSGLFAPGHVLSYSMIPLGPGTMFNLSGAALSLCLQTSP